MSASQITPPIHARPEPPRPRTILFYRQDGVVVTSRYIASGDHRYEIAQLTDLTQAKGSVHRGASAGAVIAVIEAAALAPIASVAHSPLVWLFGAIALLLTCMVALGCALRWPPYRRLLGRHRGLPVSLFGTRDRLEFGKITRALRRAIEAANTTG